MRKAKGIQTKMGIKGLLFFYKTLVVPILLLGTCLKNPGPFQNLARALSQPYIQNLVVFERWFICPG